LDLSANLTTLWSADDPAFDDYAVAIASGSRLLVASSHGELVLLDTTAERFQPVSRLTVFEDDPGVYSHPALVGTRIYLRGSEELLCIDLAGSPE
jgi:hypothetical protein